MNELETARAIRDGALPSPQTVGSMQLWDIRISGSGAAYRPSLKEFVWRDPSIVLTDETMARVAGLPVVWGHPTEVAKLNSDEFARRVVGSVMLPYVSGDELRGVCRIYDAEAIQRMTDKQLSTSPGVVFSAGAVGNRTFKVEDGHSLLFEGNPDLWDHIAVLAEGDAGVWDKMQSPRGVQNDFLPPPETTELIGMTDEEKAAADKARKDAEAKLDAIMDSMRRMDSRLDSMEREDKVRKDAEEKERKDRDRRDAARKDRFDARKDAESDEDFKKRFDADEAAMCDALRKDGEDEEAAKTAAKDARKDAVEEDEKGRSDRARRDSEAREKERMDAARHDSATSTKIADLERQLAAMSARFVPVSAEDRNMLATAQSRADGVAGLFGKRASPPVPGESPIEYRRRLASDFKQHSAKFKDSRLDSMDEATFGAIEEMVYADAVSAARSPDRGNAAGMLIKLQRQDEAGRTITEWTGDNLAWMQTFMTPGRVGRILDPRNNRI